MHVERRGSGRPLLLIHGLGSSWRAWTPVLDELAAHRSILALDLPGHGATPADPDSGTFAGLADSVEQYIAADGLRGIDVAGSSMGGRLVLELARQGVVGHVVALDPGGFWKGWEREYFRATIGASVGLLRVLRQRLPALAHNAVSRTALLAQLSTRPWRLDPALVAGELASLADTPTADSLIRDLANGPQQTGPAANADKRVVIGWGRQDRLCLPRQAQRALAAFPQAELHWFDKSGHFPMWDRPREAAALILRATEG